jgi:cytidine deaminase
MSPTASQLELLQHACKARERAYAPYSEFRVGAAVRSADGQVFAGCNIENASYGLSICAERVAVFNAISAGVSDIVQLAICTDASNPSTPCGACRQVLWEFAKAAEVVLGNVQGTVVISSMKELFPKPFELQT